MTVEDQDAVLDYSALRRFPQGDAIAPTALWAGQSSARLIAAMEAFLDAFSGMRLGERAWLITNNSANAQRLQG
jgi:hypothetical protein